MAEVVVLRGVLPRVEVEEPKPHRRPAKVAQLLALAHRWQRQIDGSEVQDQLRIAEREMVTAARVSQVMGLLVLPPHVQEWVLGLEAVDGREPVGEREVAAIAKGWAGGER